MQTASRRRTTWAIAASVLAHIAVLIVALLQRPTLALPSDESGPPEAIIPVLLLPRTPPAAAGGAPQPSAVRLHRRVQRPDDSALPVAPLPAATEPARPAPPAPPSESAAPAAPAVSAPSAGPDLRAALRHGLAGCANAGASMSRAGRERCDEQLGLGVASAPYMPAAIAPRIRAYYDAVAEAKKPDPQPTPQRAPGRLGMLDGDGRATNGHGPGIGCKITWGPGEKPKAPPHALKLGPCFIEPPKGSLSPEVDLSPP